MRQLKCSGQREGCQRCAASKVKCDYPKSSHANPSRRRRKSLASKAQPYSCPSPATSAVLSSNRFPRAEDAPSEDTDRSPTDAMSNMLTSTGFSEQSHVSGESAVINLQRPMAPGSGLAGDELPEHGEEQCTAKDVLVASTGSSGIVRADGFHVADSGCVTWSDEIISLGGDFGDLNGQPEISSESPSLNDCFSDFGELMPPFLLFSTSSAPNCLIKADFPTETIHVDPDLLTPESSLHQAPQRLQSPTGSPPTPRGNLASRASQPNVHIRDAPLTTDSKLGASNTTTRSSNSCICMTTALQLLEALEVKNSQADAPALDRALDSQKRALARCNRILDCERCNEVSSFVMLLAIICQKLMLSFQKAQEAIEMERRRGERRSKHFTSAVEDGKGQGGCLGIYRMDMWEERCIVMTALVRVQLRDFGALLGRLMALAEWGNWATHAEILRTVQRQYHGVCASLDAGYLQQTRAGGGEYNASAA